MQLIAFMHVLEIYDYYEDYFTSMYKSEIEFLKEDNTTLNEEIQENESEINRLCRIMEEQNILIRSQLAKMDRQHEDSLVMQTQLTDLQVTVNKISKKLDNYAQVPTDIKLENRFILMKSGFNYYTIRCQERNIASAIAREEKKGYSKIQNIIESEIIPNSIYLWNIIKEVLVKEKKITTYRNSFKLNISESDFIDIVKATFEQRKSHD